MPIHLAINSQTPPVRPLEGRQANGGTWRLGHDYLPQLGGVVPMTRALLAEGARSWIARNPTWVALGAPGIPGRLTTDEGYTVETVDLPDEDRARYGRFKEAIWRSFHGPRGFAPSFADYPAFVTYSYRSTLKLLPHTVDHDLFFINDFQQVLVGGLIGSAAPALLRWHIPIDFRGYPEPVRRFFLNAMQGFDGIVVSTRAGLEELIHAGFQGRAFQSYPYLDPAEHRRVAPGALRRFQERFGLGDGPVILCVSRMDPVKRQDYLLDAVQRLRRRFRDVKAVLVGGGSFSTQGGLGVVKADVWLERLRDEVRRRRLERNVVFTGTLPAEELRAAYASADAFVHPAPWEGFGLVVVEAWTHHLPVVVSSGAGSAELVSPGVNGFVVPPGRPEAIADRLAELLAHPEPARRMGAEGAQTARQCHVDRTAPRLREIFDRTIEIYGKSRRVGNHRRRRGIGP